MRARSPHEPHRAATPLELLFDLVFVVAIAQAASGLHHAISEAHALQGLCRIPDGLLRDLVGVDELHVVRVGVRLRRRALPARGIRADLRRAHPGGRGAGDVRRPRAQPRHDCRLCGDADGHGRAVAESGGGGSEPSRHGAAIRARNHRSCRSPGSACCGFQSLWVPGFLLLAALELVVPIWAERTTPTSWHPHHISERYGLLTLIVLGESILSATLAVQSALSSGEALPALTPLIIGGLLIVFSMWWVYFDRPVHDLLTSFRKAIVWGYGHYLVFAAAAAVGAGLAVNVDYATHHSKIGAAAAGRSRRDTGGDLLALPVVPSRPARVSSDEGVWADRHRRCVARPADRAWRADDGHHSGDARGGEARDAAGGQLTLREV